MLPTHLQLLAKKRMPATAQPTKKAFTEDDCHFCVDYHKGACGPDEDADPAGFAAQMCPRGKEHRRVPCKNKHNKGEVCARGPSFHFYHGYGKPRSLRDLHTGLAFSCLYSVEFILLYRPYVADSQHRPAV